MIECGDRAEPGEFTVVDDGRRWAFRGGLTFEDATRVLEASRSLPLPTSGRIDFSGLHAADSAALAVLVALKRRASHEHHKLVFEGLPEAVLALAHVYGIGEVLGAPVAAAAPAVEFEGVERRFGSVQALKGVDLAVERGEFFGLLGPNGAGKTTMISILAGLVRADAGRARVMGHDVVDDYRQARRLLGVVPQELVFDPFFTVRETLAFQAGYFGLRNAGDWIDEILAHLGLTGKANANMRALSGGMKRRVLVGQALVHKPPVIVLDEPTAGVDVELRHSLWSFIRKLNGDGHTVILTTHYLEEAEALCGRIAMLKAGRIVALDSTHNLLARFPGLTVRLAAERLPDAWHPRVQRQGNGQFHLSLEHHGELERLLHDLRVSGIAIGELSIGEADLEQVFLRIMHGDDGARAHGGTSAPAPPGGEGLRSAAAGRVAG